MQRTIFFTPLFATLAALGIAGSSWVAYQRVRSALDRDFERRLTRVAVTAASQITPDLVAEARAGGEESGYLPVQVQLVTLRTATGIDNASLIDTTRVTLVDARAGGRGGSAERASTRSRTRPWARRSQGDAPRRHVVHAGQSGLACRPAPILGASSGFAPAARAPAVASPASSRSRPSPPTWSRCPGCRARLCADRGAEPARPGACWRR